MKKIFAVAMSAVLAFSLAACGSTATTETDAGSADQGSAEASDGSLTPITVALDWTPNTNHTGLYVAEALGYFEEAGLDVTIVQPADNTAEVMIGSGGAEFGYSFQDSLAPYVSAEDPLPIAAIAAVEQHNTSGIISLASEGIDRPAAMEGHTYATWDLDVEKATLRQVVADDGGDFDNVELIPSTVTDEAAALESGSVDCIWVYYGWAGIACQLAGLDTNYFSFADINEVFDYYTPVIVGNTDWMSENPETTQAFLEALSRGYTYAAENPDEAADILCEQCPELDSELVHASQEYLSPYYIDDAEQWGVIDPDRWDAFYNWLNENELVENTIDPGTGFTMEYLGVEN